MTKPKDRDSFANLHAWNASLSPLRVDVVSDFAGKELFAIHGEALVAHCIAEAQVDFTDGFQLLHAVHAVETFLDKLDQRGCNFHVLWFDDLKELAVPLHTPQSLKYKYWLTRAVLIEHLRCLDKTDGSFDHGTANAAEPRPPISFAFPSIDSDEFISYTNENRLYFVMCSRGRLSKSTHDVNPVDEDNLLAVHEVNTVSINHLCVMNLFADEGYNLAFIDDVEFRSSKVYARVVTSSKPVDLVEVSATEVPITSQLDRDRSFSSLEWKNLQTNVDEMGPVVDAREAISIPALATILKDNPGVATEKRVAAFLVHLGMIQGAHLGQRSYEKPMGSINEDDNGFLEYFSDAALWVIRHWNGNHTGHNLDWQVCDLVDGRLFHHVLRSIEVINLAAGVGENVRRRAKLIGDSVGTDILRHLPSHGASTTQPAQSASIEVAESKGQGNTNVLPFNHPVIDPYLEEVKLKVDGKAQESTTSSQIFRELTHWHNAKKKLVDQKHGRAPPPWWVMKRNQRLMADTVAYSASLTNAAGKNINPETIISQERKGGRDGSKSASTEPQSWKVALAQKNASKGAKSGGRNRKAEALEEAKSIQDARNKNRSNEVVKFFAQQCHDFDKVKSLLKRYLKANKYLLGLSNADREVIGGELSLYICNTLSGILGEPAFSGREMSAIALLRSHVVDMCAMPLTTETTKQLQHLTAALKLQMPAKPLSAIPTRRLPFDARFHQATQHIKVSKDEGGREFQLQHCGPYLDRSFDSAPDPRVPFHPDAWQRKVLDAIDKNNSLLVVAPTSAGKTFISFYAMKKILQANDEDVLVYVAPTKALVNQIAAEIQARFSKSYSAGGKSVWAIHTRDYRINNPVGCQILVTVPHILQIMLMAPSNAKKPTSWSRRVRRIIFDEVHCIGQAEDGIVWEQLLLLAPCPIIALSATVGNPLQFREWLAGAQKAKGFDLEMVVHNTRYSDLRKFIYQPPADQTFGGFQPVERLPIPGLDADSSDTNRFIFVHPVGSIVNKNREVLKDATLEPRDCLSLWRTMKKHKDETHSVNDKLGPSHALPEFIKKPDITRWEAELKDELTKWMGDSSSPFEHVHSAFQPSSGHSMAAQETIDSAFALLSDLRSCGALPAILFNYDRDGCEKLLFKILTTLESAEQTYRDTNKDWKKKVEEHERRKALKEKAQPKSTTAAAKRKADNDAEGRLGKLDQLRENANSEADPGANFDPEAPIEQFSLADSTKISMQELDDMIYSLRFANIEKPVIDALRRGLGVHHAGMNRKYRQVVEMLFRKGFLTAVIATGTLALGLNMPCKTVVFAGDSVFLTALSYRQASGRAGRRGFDLLGNVVFHGIPRHRSLEIMSSRLPDLKGQFPISVTLVLRLFGLLHGTDGSEYAAKAVQSLLTQTQLYLGGPSSQMSIKHHLRFSIDYLRRQNLLSADGAPINFAGLVGHLYFTENAVFAFHSLLKEGYLHELCEDIDVVAKRKDLLLELLKVLCHLFGRIPCHRYMNEKWLQDVVHESPSIVLLPRLPEKAEQILRGHNKATLQIFQNYARTFVDQHLSDTPDDALPFTKCRVAPQPTAEFDLRTSNLPFLPATTLRSPFAALSGFTDSFATIQELCESVRAGVFLEEEAVPYIPIYPDETNGVPFNAYILDFFKHGDMKALVRDNGIKAGDVWFLLKDFSLVLATIVTSLTNVLDKNSGENDDLAMLDLQDVGDILDEEVNADQNDKDLSIADAVEAASAASETAAAKTKAKKKKAVADSWEDEDDEDGEAEPLSDENTTAENENNTTIGGENNGGKGLMKVYLAFKLLQQEFDETFRKVWA